MSWTEIVIEVARNEAEALSDALMDAGALSVSIEDADFGTAAEKPLFGEPGMEPENTAWNRSKVIALTASDADHAELVTATAEACGMSRVLPYALREVGEQDWVRLTQSQFDPIHIGSRIWVVPSWHAAPDPNALVLELDPGLAFGTGSHATTRLCMEWLERHLPAGAPVLDYGCGSGILAILAKKLGGSTVIGVDIDPQAIESAQHNAERNACDISLCTTDEFSFAHGDSLYGLVVANILAGPLMLLAPTLTHHVAPDGWLVLSGILVEQADEVIQSYAPRIRLESQGSREGWVVLAGRAAKNPPRNSSDPS
jgi:ribosomal protein L11 methyltransferase